MKLVVALGLVMAMCCGLVGGALAGHKVLVVFSYHAEYPWVVDENRGLESVLGELDTVEIERLYLDTKRHTSASWMTQVAETAVARIEDYQPDLLMVFDDNACELVARRYVGTSLPVVFAGMNAEPGQYGFPAENVTGVLERVHVAASIELLQRLVPDVERIALLADDSPTSRGLLVRTQATPLPVQSVAVETTNDFATWKAAVERFQTEADALMLSTYHTLREAGCETSVAAEDVLKWTLAHSGIPECAVFDFSVREGALCGVVASGFAQGQTAAEMARTILAGASPTYMSVRVPEEGNPMVNEDRARQLGIMLPENLQDDVKMLP